MKKNTHEIKENAYEIKEKTYNICICYKCKKSGSEEAGTNIAVSLYYALTYAGYDVYLDCIHGSNPDTTLAMERSQLILLLIASDSLADHKAWDDDHPEGLHKELVWLAQHFFSEEEMKNKEYKHAKKISKKKPNAPKVLPLSIENALEETDTLPYFKWIKESFDYERFTTGRNFDASFLHLLKVISDEERENAINIQPRHNTIKEIEIDLEKETIRSKQQSSVVKRTKRKLKIAIFSIALLILTTSLFAFDAAQPVIVTTGNNTVSEYLQGAGDSFSHRIKGDGMSLNDRHRFFFHSKSSDVWKSLNAAFRRSKNAVTGQFPILLTTDTMPSAVQDKLNKRMRDTNRDTHYRILQYTIDSIDLAVYIFRDTNITKESNEGSSITDPDKLFKLLTEGKTFVMGTDDSSNITKAFNSFLNPTLRNGTDSIKIERYRNFIFPKYDSCYLDTIKKHTEDGGTVILFDNTSVEYGTSINKIAERIIISKKIPLYAYTIVRLDGDCLNGYKIKFLNGQKKFFLSKRLKWENLHWYNNLTASNDEFNGTIIKR